MPQLVPLLLPLLLPQLSLGQVPKEPPQGCLDSGACYIGSWQTTTKGNTFASFQGIRFAQPPIAEKRFLPPQPFLAEEGEYDVSKESTIVCPQTTPLSPEPFGDEDCLMLNIYVPDSGEGSLDPIPVMVWIHGGGLRQVGELSFILRASSIQGANKYTLYGPQLYLDRWINFVTFEDNIRLPGTFWW